MRIIGVMYTATTITDEQKWNQIINQLDGHPLQLWGWGTVKAAHGWRVERVIISREEQPILAAQLLVRSLPMPFRCLVYIPRGPSGGLDDQAARTELERYVRITYKPVCLTVEPDTSVSLKWGGWRRSANRILLARTAVLDLTQDEAAMQEVMSKKTRQYIRKSAGEGMTVTRVSSKADIEACLAIYKQTATRAGFALHDDKYYTDILAMMKDDVHVYAAKMNGEVVSFLWLIVTPEVAFELYGGMSEDGQRLRANYHLKWWVIQTMKHQGVRRYDVNGLLNDGVTAFKKGFIPAETQMSGTYDKPMSPLYFIWAGVLPAAKTIAQKLRH